MSIIYLALLPITTDGKRIVSGGFYDRHILIPTGMYWIDTRLAYSDWSTLHVPSVSETVVHVEAIH